MIWKIILWVSILWLVPLMYVLLKNEARPKKNIVVGVTLPYEGRGDGEVQALLVRFRRELGGACLALLVLAGALMLLPVSFGLMLTIWLIWIDVCVVLPLVPYVRCNLRLKELKRAKGWETGRRWTAAADLPAAQPEKEASPARFVFPLVVSALPVWWAFGWGERLEGLILLTGPACVALFWLCYRWAYRRKAEAVDGDAARTAALTSLRRRTWRRCWLWGAWFMALINCALLLSFDYPLAGGVLVAVLTAALVAVMVGLELRLRRLQERLTADSGQGRYVDEDDKWLWGMFYYDPDDSRLLISARVGMNTTVNLARRAGQVIIAVTAALLLLMPLTGVWLMGEERAPVTLALEGDTLVAAHSTTRYEIPLEEIQAVELLDQLPALRRVAGTAMETVDKGSFRSEAYGPLTVCLNPQAGPWLLVKTGERNYLLGGENGADIYAALSAPLAGQTAPAGQ